MTGGRQRLLVVFAVIGTAILLGLGTWQVQRLQWKTDLIAKVEARVAAEPLPLEEVLAREERGEDTEYLPVRVSGGFPSDRVAHVFGTYDGEAGFYVFQVMRLDGSPERHLLVNRGFVPQENRQAAYPLPDAEALTGLVRHYEGDSAIARAVAPAEEEGSEAILYSRERGALIRYLAPEDAATFLPFAVDSTLPTDVPRGGTTRLSFRNAHLGYAITWYGLAAGLVVVTVLLIRRERS